MRKIVLIFLMLFSSHAYSQIQNTWMTGHLSFGPFLKGGVDFSSSSADTFSLYRDMGFYAINTMINDTSGNLLFYSNGIYMANSNHDTLLNSTNFNPGYATAVGNTFGLNLTQSLLIFPFSENSEFYAVIHCSANAFMMVLFINYNQSICHIALLI